MEALGLLFHGFAVLFTWKIMALMMVGLVLGIFVGVLPGLGGPNGVAILLPLTFTMDPTSAIVMLSCIYWGALFGGAITSILFNIPGEAWAVATACDGYPRAQQGQAAEALTAAFTSSFIGSLVAVMLITFLAPSIAGFALKFGPPEFFAVYLLTFCSFVGLGREAKHKTVISMALGLLLAGVGLDTVSGQLRMTFASNDLMRGINFLVAVIGLFGIGEIMINLTQPDHTRSVVAKKVTGLWLTMREFRQAWPAVLRGTGLGSVLGALAGTPGARAREGAIQARAQALLAALGLGDVAEEPAEALAAGLRRRLEIARALATDPLLLMLDEPAAGLSPAEIAALDQQLTALRDQGGPAVILVEHHMDLVMAVSDRITVLDYGRVIADGAPEAVRGDPAVIEAYLGGAS